MNVFVETNFVLELSLDQEQHESCERILELAKARRVSLLLPAYSLIEPHETLIRRHRERRELKRRVGDELGQLARSHSLASAVDAAQAFPDLLIQSVDLETEQVQTVVKELCNLAEVLPLDASVLKNALAYQAQHDLSPQDSVVYASVLSYLHGNEASTSCLISKNWKDFDDPDIRAELESLSCKYFPRFDTAIEYIESQVGGEKTS